MEERKLGAHDPGQVLAASVRVVSSTVVDGQRKVVVTREFQGKTTDHFTFSTSNSSVPVLLASGTGPTFGYHGPRQRWSFAKRIKLSVDLANTANPFALLPA